MAKVVMVNGRECAVAELTVGMRMAFNKWLKRVVGEERGKPFGLAVSEEEDTMLDAASRSPEALEYMCYLRLAAGGVTHEEFVGLDEVAKMRLIDAVGEDMLSGGDEKKTDA